MHFKMHLCAVRMRHCGWHRESNYKLPAKRALNSAVAPNFWPILLECVISTDFCMHRRLGTQQGNFWLRFLARFLEKLKPKLIPHYPITSMKLNVDDSIKDNFLSFRLLRNLEQHVLSFFSWTSFEASSRHTLHFSLDEKRRRKKSTQKFFDCNFMHLFFLSSLLFFFG
jgi:hypothetical protein